ncbi:TIR domain-containing protein [Polaribacter sp. MSW13]|uniref:TIR domain-containing protein n=1 Tax=Polaribacter marinus TaxID=2916838 RepID=A0A9X2AMR1_9FLAO|nr:TIR domain-containing protein [Polaribacter marinus]MCI2230460.1 TIR domain-containing protein [Polaribacter marinus]
MKKLKVLNVNRNKIKSLPKQIQQLENLKILLIANNEISNLPSTFSNLRNLKELNLSHNNFKIFPKELYDIKTLQKIWINDLPLKKLPRKEIIENLINLNSIYCFGNKQDSKSLDPFYFQLTKLKGNLINELKTIEIIELKKTKTTLKKETKIMKNQIFISYSHEDRIWLEKVQIHLKALEHEEYNFDLWDDTKIKTGDKWKQEIEKALEKASIAILLISANFLASDFIKNDELPTLLRNAELKGTRILPVIIKPCIFSRIKNLSTFQALNNPEKALSDLTDSEVDKEMVKLTLNILEILESN